MSHHTPEIYIGRGRFFDPSRGRRRVNPTGRRRFLKFSSTTGVAGAVGTAETKWPFGNKKREKGTIKKLEPADEFLRRVREGTLRFFDRFKEVQIRRGYTELIPGVRIRGMTALEEVTGVPAEKTIVMRFDDRDANFPLQKPKFRTGLQYLEPHGSVNFVALPLVEGRSGTQRESAELLIGEARDYTVTSERARVGLNRTADFLLNPGHNRLGDLFSGEKVKAYEVAIRYDPQVWQGNSVSVDEMEFATDENGKTDYFCKGYLVVQESQEQIGTEMMTVHTVQGYVLHPDALVPVR